MSAKWLGTEYGGKFVDLSIINSESIVYSFGVGEDISFDLELNRAAGCGIYLFDPTPKAIKYITGITVPNSFKFCPIGIYDRDGYIQFSSPQIPSHVSYKIYDSEMEICNHLSVSTFEVLRLKTFMEILGHKNIDVLKMDIESSELAVINDMLKCKIYPRQILVEIHLSDDKITIPKMLMEAGYELIATDNIEYCFARKE